MLRIRLHKSKKPEMLVKAGKWYALADGSGIMYVSFVEKDRSKDFQGGNYFILREKANVLTHIATKNSQFPPVAREIYGLNISEYCPPPPDIEIRGTDKEIGEIDMSYEVVIDDPEDKVMLCESCSHRNPGRRHNKHIYCEKLKVYTTPLTSLCVDYTPVKPVTPERTCFSCSHIENSKTCNNTVWCNLGGYIHKSEAEKRVCDYYSNS
jgi:hypothetical protein